MTEGTLRKITFRVPGQPIKKSRPKVGRARRNDGTEFPTVRTPAETRHWQAIVGTYAQNAKVVPMDGPLRMSVLFVHKMTGTPLKRSKRPWRYKETIPDVDNLAKLVMDALNGIAYRDDSQVAELRTLKIYGEQDELPGTIVTLELLEEGDEALLAEYGRGVF